MYPRPYDMDFNVKVRVISALFAPNYKISDDPTDAYKKFIHGGIVHCPAPTEAMVEFFDSRGVAEEFCAMVCAATYMLVATGKAPTHKNIFITIIDALLNRYGLDEKVIEFQRILWVLIVKMPVDERENGPVINYRTYVEQYKKDQ